MERYCLVAYNIEEKCSRPPQSVDFLVKLRVPAPGRDNVARECQTNTGNSGI